MTAKTPGYFRTIRIIHNSFLVRMLFFAATIFFLVRSGKFRPVDSISFDRILQVVVLLVAGILLIVGFRLFKKRIVALHQSPDPAEKKLDQYRSACISWWAMIEGPGMVAIISLLLTSNYAFFVLACFHIIILAFLCHANTILFFCLTLIRRK